MKIKWSNLLFWIIKIVCMKLCNAILSYAFLMVSFFNFLKINSSTLLTSLMVKKNPQNTIHIYLYRKLHIVLWVISQRHSLNTFFYSLSSQKGMKIPLFIIKPHFISIALSFQNIFQNAKMTNEINL